jgi:hypothetical protein
LKKLKDIKAQSKQTDIFFWQDGFHWTYGNNLQILPQKIDEWA